MKSLFSFLLLFLLCACKNTTDPILKESQCIARHQELYNTIVPMTVCNKTCTTTMVPTVQVRTICDREIFIEYPNPDYRPEQP